MAYGAYQIAAPQMSLQEELMKRRSAEDTSVDVGMKKKSLQEDLLEQIEKKQRASQKRAGSFLGVEGLGTALTTGLDFASGFMPGAFGALTGGLSGLIGGYNEMRAADKLGAGGLGKEFGKYKFLAPQLKGVQAQAKEMDKGWGEVLTSAGVGALKGFTAGQLGQVGGEADKLEAIEKAKTAKEVTSVQKAFPDAIEAGTLKLTDTGQIDLLNTGTDVMSDVDLEKYTKLSELTPMEKFGAEASGQAKSMFDIGAVGADSADQMQKIAMLTQQFAPLLEGLTKKRPQLDLRSLY